MARRGKEMNQDKDHEGTEHHPWGTLEELLLACAVNRHGAKSWDSIATELQKRASSFASLHHYHHLRAAAAYSPPNCKQRYHDLLRRFSAVDGDNALVDELKKLRVAELRREVERHDDSIELLELKVKRLEEEREQRTEETLETGGTDLPDELDNREPEENSRRERTGSGDDNENDNQSFDESNTTSSQKGENREQNGDEPVPVHEEVKAVEKCSLSLEEGTKENNENNVIDEVESPRTKKRRRSSGEDEAEGRKLVQAKEIASKSQPLIKILGMLRSHKNGSLFERRLRSQETDNYKKMIRQHMDLQTVQSRLDRGFYLTTTSNKNSHLKFFRDLLLLYTNAIIFFPTTSPHHSAALELRHILTKHMPTIPSTPKPDPEPKQPDPVHSRTGRPVIKLRQPGNNNNPVPPKPDPGKKQPVIRQPGTIPVPQKSEPSKKEPVSLHPRPNKVGPKLERSEEKLHSNRVSMGNKAVEEKPSKKQTVKERPEWSRRSGRVGSGYSEKEKKKTPRKEVEEDGSNIEDGGETEKEKKRRGERGRNNVSVKKGRQPSKSPVGRDVGRGKRGRREGGEPPPMLDSGRPRKRSKR